MAEDGPRLQPSKAGVVEEGSFLKDDQTELSGCGMKIEFSITPEDLSVEKQRGISGPPAEGIFISLCYPATLIVGTGKITLREVTLARFAFEILNALYRFREGAGSSEHVYRDFYGGLTLRLENNRDGIRIENPDSHEAVVMSLKEALNGFSEFGEAVVRLVKQISSEAPGLDLLEEAIERCAIG
jgi:hypothetical protein